MRQTAMEGWRSVKLKDLCQEITVGHVGPMANEYVQNGIPFLRSQNILPFHLDLSDVKYINGNFHKKLKKSALRPGDVAVVRTGYPGTACVIPPYLPEANCADLVIIRTLPQLNPYYLALIFNSTVGRSTVAGRLVGVAQQHFNVSAAKEMYIDVPPLSTQRTIASILSAYDDLIENNTRRIVVLEEMAQMLYQEWFVKFRFPGYEQVRMRETEMGMVPEGWEVAPFSEVAELSRAGIDPGKFRDETFIHYSIPAFDEGRMPVLEQGESIKSNKYLIPEGVVLLSKLNPRIPRVWLPIDTVSGFVVTSTEFLVLIPKVPYTREFIYCFCSSQGFIDQFVGKAIGTSTSHQRVKPDNLMGLPVILPASQSIKDFTKIVSPTFRNIQNLRLRNASLRRTRDMLLPKLVGGEIDVSGWEGDKSDGINRVATGVVATEVGGYEMRATKGRGMARVEPLGQDDLEWRSLWES